MRRIALTVAGSLLAAGVAVVSAKAFPGTGAAQALPVYGQVPPFALMDQQGEPVTPKSLEGSVWIADFIFTRCAGQCPLMTDRMAALQRAFEHDADVRLVSVSVDPAYDTPEVLAAYAQRVGVHVGRWRLLTGSDEQVRRLAQEGFRLGVGDDGTPDEPITHSVRLVLVDRQGRIRGYYDATDAERFDRLRRDIRSLLRHAS